MDLDTAVATLLKKSFLQTALWTATAVHGLIHKCGDKAIASSPYVESMSVDMTMVTVCPQLMKRLLLTC